MPAPTHCPPSQADEAWKYMLDTYFPAFIACFYPEIDDQIDWATGYTMLDQELLALTTESMIGKRLVDKLVQIYDKTGQAVLLHTEVQGDDEAEFPYRLFRYYSRLDERYPQPILTLALLTDERLDWRPQHYQAGVWHRPVIHFDLFAKKLLDYRGKEKEKALLAMANPFGTMIVAQLAAINTRGQAPARYERKVALTRHLYDKGLERDDFLHLYYAIDSLLTLPPALKLRYHRTITQFEKEREMAFITTAEEFGLKKGLKQGLKKGRKEGKEEGRKEGKEEGKEEGRKEGKEEGRKEGKKEKAQAIARNMLAKGFEPALIKEVTGLSDEEIVALMH